MGLKADIEKNFFWVRPALSVFGFWKQIATLIAAAGLFVWTLVDHLPWSVIAAVVFTTTVSSVYLLLLPAFFRVIAGSVKGAGAANLMIYKDVQQFYVWQAACLLAGVSPALPLPTSEARDWRNALIDALRKEAIARISSRRDDLLYTTDRVYGPHNATTINRDELKKFSAAHNRNPEFLA